MNSANSVILFRGIAGAGKTTAYETFLAKRVDKYSELAYCSTDLFWRGENGRYNFDPRRLGEAHAWNFRHYLEFLSKKVKTIVVDNTNISAHEIAPYVLAATAYCYAHEIVTVWCDPAIAAARSVHGVPAKVVLDMHSRLVREELPPYWNHRVVFDGKIL